MKKKGICNFLLVSFLLTLSLLCILFPNPYIHTVFADTESISDTVEINALVKPPSLPIAPPPLPKPLNNNAIPLPANEMGTNAAVFKGRAYPGSTISIIKNGLPLNVLPANPDGTFEVPVHNINPGTYTFSIQATDKNQIVSSLVTKTILITAGIETEVQGILMPPTITTDKIEVKKGDPIIFSGYSIPSSVIFLTIFTKDGVTRNVTSDSNGYWSYSFPTNQLGFGSYDSKAQEKIKEEYSTYSANLTFTVGSTNKIRKVFVASSKNRCDLNNDTRVNLLDFSIMAFWYKRLGFPLKVDLNSDGRINLTDLSILAYCWTG